MSEPESGLFEKLLSEDLHKHWFLWLERVFLTGALYAVAEKTGSLLVYGAFFISGLIVFLRAWSSFERFVDEHIPLPKRKTRLSTAFIWIVTFLVGIAPIALMMFIGHVLRGLLGD